MGALERSAKQSQGKKRRRPHPFVRAGGVEICSATMVVEASSHPIDLFDQLFLGWEHC